MFVDSSLQRGVFIRITVLRSFLEKSQVKALLCYVHVHFEPADSHKVWFVVWSVFLLSALCWLFDLKPFLVASIGHPAHFEA